MQAQAAADPFVYEAYREKLKQEKIEAERASRITVGSFFHGLLIKVAIPFLQPVHVHWNFCLADQEEATQS